MWEWNETLICSSFARLSRRFVGINSVNFLHASGRQRQSARPADAATLVFASQVSLSQARCCFYALEVWRCCGGDEV